MSRYNEVGQSWQDDGSLDNANWLFQVLYRPFDNDPNIMKKLAEDYMQENNLEYASEKINDTIRGADGCIDLIITDVKRELIKNINARSRVSHGYRVTITREKGEQVTKKRRIPGVFHEWFRKYGGDAKFENVNVKGEKKQGGQLLPV